MHVLHYDRYHKSVMRMERGLMPNKLVPAFRASVDELRSLLPVTQVTLIFLSVFLPLSAPVVSVNFNLEISKHK